MCINFFFYFLVILLFAFPNLRLYVQFTIHAQVKAFGLLATDLLLTLANGLESHARVSQPKHELLGWVEHTYLVEQLFFDEAGVLFDHLKIIDCQRFKLDCFEMLV